MKVDSGHCVENGLKEAGVEEIVRRLPSAWRDAWWPQAKAVEVEDLPSSEAPSS